MEVTNLSKYGYIRVSTKGQNEDRQLLAMRDLAIPEKNLIAEKQSGKDFDRPGMSRATFYRRVK